MLPTNRHFQTELERLAKQIAKLEVVEGVQNPSATATSLRADLSLRRTTVQLLLLRRRVEAAKKVVDFTCWREGGSALGLLSRWATPQPMHGVAAKQ
jgi:hypothetical protein